MEYKSPYLTSNVHPNLMNSIQYFNKLIMNNVLYMMMSCIGKKQNPNEPIHLFIIVGGIGTSKTFTLMFLIQSLIRLNIIDVLI